MKTKRKKIDHERIDFIVDLLKEFDALLNGWTENYGGSIYFSNFKGYVEFDMISWLWLEKLLIELRNRRACN